MFSRPASNPSIITILALIAGLSFSSAAAAAEPGDHMLVEAKRLNVRSGPGTNFRTQGSITKGFGIKILEKSGEWVKVQMSTRKSAPAHQVVGFTDSGKLKILTGWVKETYLREPTSPWERESAELSSGELYLSDKLITQKFLSSKGEVYVTRRGYDSTLVVGKEKKALSYHKADLDQVKGDWFILTTYSGGTACPASKYLLDAGKSPISLQDFGLCGDLHRVEVKENTIEMSAGTALGEGKVVYVYDGQSLEKKNLGLQDRDSVDNPYDPVAWVGSYPYEYVTAPQLEGFLLEKMGLDELDMFRHSVELGKKFELRDGWVTASGCKGGQCNTFVGAIAISVQTGEPYLMYRRDRTEGWKEFGVVPDVLPAGIREIRYNY